MVFSLDGIVRDNGCGIGKTAQGCHEEGFDRNHGFVGVVMNEVSVADEL
jgi:hypothetical protein